MTDQSIHEIIQKQQSFFHTNTTLDVDFRIQALKKLQASIWAHEEQIHAALKKDLGKSSFESYMCETGLVLTEITYMLKHIRALSKPKRVHTPLAQFCSKSYQLPSPYGVVLVMSPWNYPFLLSFDPLVQALAAGNTVVLKPSAYSPATTKIVCEIIRECFADSYVSVVTGGREENACLLQEHFNYIFFTGSQSVGKEVMRHASAHLTPVTLELGGKSPCIVDKTADIKLAAKRIVFGKFLNCGQTCVAPDYIYCHQDIKEELLKQIQKQIRKQFGKSPLEHPDYGKIINEKHFHRLCGLIDQEKIFCGGTSNPQTLQIAPTVLDQVQFQDPVMQEEIFGPLLPVLTFDSTEEAIRQINSMAHPLALYVFTQEKHVADQFLSQCGFGGGCVNDVLIHLATCEMPFGGFQESGMGSYHGKKGFDTFTHYKSIVDKKTWIDLPMRYRPYRKFHNKLIHFFLK